MFWTGSQVTVVRKPKPNLERAGQPPIRSDTSTPPSAISSAVAAPKQSPSKTTSKPAPWGLALRSGAPAAFT